MIRYSVLLLAALSLNAAASPTYQVTRIVELDGHFFNASINNLGQVAGSRAISTSLSGFLWKPGDGLTDLGFLGGLGGGDVNDVNDNGQVTGYRGSQGFVWTESGGFSDLGFPSGGSQSTANSINNDGKVVGGGGAFGPFVNDSGTFEPLTGITTARQINDNDEVAGRLLFDSIYYHAALLPLGGSAIDLGVLPGDQYSEAQGLNNLGQSVGYSRPDLSSNTYRAFVWRDSGSGIQELLPLVPTDDFVQAQAINDAGFAVGFSGKATGFAIETTAAMWEQDGTVFDLNDLIDPADPYADTLNLTYAVDINQQGQILALGLGDDIFDQQSFILTPVPLPAAAWLFAFALAGLAATRRKLVGHA